VTRPLARLRLLRLLCAAIACAGAGACWPGWMEMFEQTPSSEHRVEDLRVLAIDVEPASITVPAALAYSDDGASLELSITPRIFDPRGGTIELGVSLCGSRDRFTQCSGGGIAVTQRTVQAHGARPLGPVDETVRVTLTRAQLAQLWADVEVEFPSLIPITVLINVSVVREVDGVTEREVAVLPLEARVNPLDALVPNEDLRAVSLTRCASLDEDLQCGGTQVTAVCGDDEIGPGEACDPPVIDMCSDVCQSVAFCPSQLPALCARAATPNQRPLIAGLIESSDLFVPVFDVEPDYLPGARIPTQRGARLSIVPVLRSADQELRALSQGAAFEGFGPGDTPLPVDDGATDDEGYGCAPLPSFTCPMPESLSTRFYIADGDAEIVAPSDEAGSYIGNSGGHAGVTLFVGDEAGEVPLVIVVSDGAGGMSVASFTLDVR
jgi:hypothetical protein